MESANIIALKVLNFDNNKDMIKIYVMESCPDCTAIKAAAKGDARFEVIDLGDHVRNLKEFMRLRDSHPKFKVARERGLVGIPSFLFPDGTVSFNPVRAGLILPESTDEADATGSNSAEQGAACSIDGSGC